MMYLLQHTVLNSAEKFPDREAFRCGQQCLTYSETVVAMHQVAVLLHSLDIQKGDRVGIFLNRSIETVIAIYGIMCAGGIYVPLDPKAPAERSRFLIKDCDIQILISHPSQRRGVKNILEKETGLKAIIGLKEEWEVQTIAWSAVKELAADFDSPFSMVENDPAYIIYTSGSTGVPKGIVHTHYSGLSYAKLTAGVYGLTENDRIGNHAPIHFDISTLGYFTAPLVGACTVIIPEAYIVLTASLTTLIVKEKLTVWYSVPLALIQMLQNGLLEERNMKTLRWVLYAGEAFTPKHLRSLMFMWPHARFSNIYGPAEVNQCTYYHLPKPPRTNDPIPLGQVWGNSEMIIMDGNNQPIEDDTPGELLIRSATMMRGYWKNPTLTNSSIYKRKGAAGFDELFYRTGDLVQLHSNGQLLFLGRKDRQVKVRGYRVELDEVETILLKIPAVVEAAVIVIKEENFNKIQAVVILNDEEITASDLNQILKKQLPPYAIPEVITIVSTLPRSSSGKIDRKALVKSSI